MSHSQVQIRAPWQKVEYTPDKLRMQALRQHLSKLHATR